MTLILSAKASHSVKVRNVSIYIVIKNDHQKCSWHFSNIPNGGKFANPATFFQWEKQTQHLLFESKLQSFFMPVDSEKYLVGFQGYCVTVEYLGAGLLLWLNLSVLYHVGGVVLII